MSGSVSTNPTTGGLWSQVKDRGGSGDRSALGLWIWDIDRVLLALALVMMMLRAPPKMQREPHPPRIFISVLLRSRKRC